LNSEKEIERLKRLLEHWIEHNAEHMTKYKEWAENVREERLEVSDLLLKAVEKFEEGEEFLRRAKKILG
jgi:DNA gyrase/topoisomerase IV subunit A